MSERRGPAARVSVYLVRYTTRVRGSVSSDPCAAVCARAGRTPPSGPPTAALAAVGA